MALSERFLAGATAVPGLKVYGITDVEMLAERTPTFAVSLAGYTPAEVAAELGRTGHLRVGWALLRHRCHGTAGAAGQRRSGAHWLRSLQHLCGSRSAA